MHTPITYDPYTLKDNGTECVTLDGFSGALHKLINTAWGRNWGIYSEEEPTGANPEEMSAPHITFIPEVREIAEQFPAFRGKHMESHPDSDNPGYNLHIKRRIFRCVVTWKCWHKTMREARLLCRKLEHFVENYMWYFKEHGLMQARFLKEDKPKVDKSTRQKISCTALQYEVYIVESEIIRDKLLHDIYIKVNQNNES